ncbi:MAG: CpsB/CapC family capsule biosynthesis tyrosine phosphatase [Ruthenibacterium sp.]
MTDLHCHILPGIDDGSKSIETSLTLLQQQKEQGVTHIAYTPHFRCDEQDVNLFLKNRLQSVRALHQAAVGMGFSFVTKLGAEAYFSPTLAEIDLAPICLQGTKMMLVELPVTYNSSFTMDVLYEVQLQGITPIIAHIERYPYAVTDMNFIYELVNAGCIIQTNAASIVRKDALSKVILKLIRWNLIHIVASDTHSAHRRPSRMGDAATIIKAKLGEQTWQQLEANAAGIFAGDEFMPADAHCPRKFFGKWI